MVPPSRTGVAREAAFTMEAGEADVAQHVGAGSDEGGGVDLGYWRTGRIGTTTQANTGWPPFDAGRKVMSWIWATAA